MIVNNLKVEPISTILIAGHDLNRMSQYEYLGMMIHEKFNMDVQIESMYKKANTKLVYCPEFVVLLQQKQQQGFIKQ